MMGKIKDVNFHIAHRVLDGIKDLPAKDISAFILQNVAEGFARGLVRELKENERI